MLTYILISVGIPEIAIAILYGVHVPSFVLTAKLIWNELFYASVIRI